MSVEIKMPKLGMTMKEGKVSRWFKKEGDSVQGGEDLYEIETEKITNKVESPATGILFQIVVPEGTVVPIGAIIGIIAEPGEQPERIEGIRIGEVEEMAPTPSEAREQAAAETPREEIRVSATPAARRLAKELGIDLSQVPGTGSGGRIKEADVTRFHEEGPPKPKITPLAEEIAGKEGIDISTISGTGEGGRITKEDVLHAIELREQEEEVKEEHSIPFSGMRKAVAENMHASLQSTAQLTLFMELDVTESLEFLNLVREKYKQDEAVRVSMNDIIILATSRALKRFPIMNSTQVGDEILLHNSVRMGIAVALPEGLIVPVLRNTDKMGLLQIAREARELARKARKGALTVDEVSNGTFTITNLSGFGVDGFTPILKPPETGILGVGRVVEKPAVHDGEITIRSMMFLSLTIDHRVVDGAPASEFLRTLARYLENPTLIMT